MKVDFYRHSISPDQAGKIAAVLETPFLTTGPVSKGVEAQLRDFFNVGHAFLTNSWTNGAIALLLASKIGPGDEVIVPAMTFVATANVVEIVGARPVFVDVDPNTLLMRPEDAARAVTANTRAVFPVHLYGQMVDIAALRAELHPRNDILIFEDCAHCFEGKLDGDLSGKHSDAALFSFYATKNVACGEGGAIILHDDALADRVQQARLHGMSAGAVDRFKTGSYNHWDVVDLGTKANLPDLLAAFLPDQIAGVYERLEKRRVLAEGYQEAFSRSNAIRCVAPVEGALHAHHLFPIAVPAEKRDFTLNALAEHGIGATVNYRGVPVLTYYAEKYGFNFGDFPASDEWGAATLSLPLYPGMEPDAQTYVADTLLNEIVPKF